MRVFLTCVNIGLEVLKIDIIAGADSPDDVVILGLIQFGEITNGQVEVATLITAVVGFLSNRHSIIYKLNRRNKKKCCVQDIWKNDHDPFSLVTVNYRIYSAKLMSE